MIRERMLQIVLVILGLLFLATIYFLYNDLWHAHWILEKRNEIEPMFLSVFVVLGPFLLVAAEPAGASLADCVHSLVVPGACRRDGH